MKLRVALFWIAMATAPALAISLPLSWVVSQFNVSKRDAFDSDDPIESAAQKCAREKTDAPSPTALGKDEAASNGRRETYQKEYESCEKAILDRKLAFDTQRIADY